MQQTKERTFFEIVKRFFAPTVVKWNKLVTLRSCTKYFIYWAMPIVHIYFIKSIIASIENDNKELFIDLIIYYIIANILYEILEFIVKKWWWVEDIGIFREVIHKEYISKFIKLDNNEIEKLWTWKLTALIDKWMNIWSLSLNTFIYNFFQIITTFLFASYMIFSLKMVYWVLFFIIYLLIHIVWVFINNYTLKYRRKREDYRHIYVGRIVKIIMNKFEILQTWKVSDEIISLDKANRNMMVINKKMAPYVHIFFRIPWWFVTRVQVFVIFYLGLEIFEWNISISTFVWIFGILTVLSSSIVNSMTFFKDFTKDFTSIEKMWDFFDSTNYMSSYETWNNLKYKSGKIELKDITFWYSENNKVFNNFSLKIAGEKITAMVWASWGWKSTLAKLISGYIKADSWEITIDWQKLSELSLKGYYKEIWYLTQEPSVFDGTVLENLTYTTWSDVSERKIEKVIKLAKCEFIRDLPYWINTEIWERWVRLSWWQKQRLAIAKIFLKDPKIIILDEPTSALDSFSEELITKAMHNLFKDRTVIIIAHRLQTVKHADKIFVIEWWKVVEEWNHKELVKKKGIYKRMLDLQSGF